MHCDRCDTLVEFCDLKFSIWTDGPGGHYCPKCWEIIKPQIYKNFKAYWVEKLGDDWDDLRKRSEYLKSDDSLNDINASTDLSP